MNPPSAPCQCKHTRSIIAVDRQIEIASPNSVGSLQPAQNTFKLGGRLCAMSGYSDHRKCFPNQIQPARRAKARRRACAVSRELQQTLSRVAQALETLTGRSASNKAPAQLICQVPELPKGGPPSWTTAGSCWPTRSRPGQINGSASATGLHGGNHYAEECFQ